MNKLHYFLLFIFLFSLASLVNAQDWQTTDCRNQDKLPITSDELVKYHLEKMRIDELGGKNIQIQHLSKLLPDFYVRDTYLMQTWDGTAWKDSVRGDYTYNPQGWLTELTYKIWSTVWINNTHYTYTYNGYGYVATEIIQTWNGSSWLNFQRRTHTYNSSNKPTQTNYEQWNGSSWVNSDQYLYEYYPDGNLYKYIYQYWTGSNWSNSDQYSYEYDSNDLRIVYLYQHWNGGVWLNISKWNYSYNSNGDYLTEVRYVWDNGWQNYRQSLYTYDGNGWLTTKIQQSWDSSIGWINAHKYSYTYDGSGNHTVQLHQSWDGSQWYNYDKYTNVYNGQGDKIEYTYEVWNTGTGWENESHFNGDYDANGNVLTEEYQSWDGTEWINIVCYTYTWLFFVSDVEEDGLVKEYSLDNNYPNPFNPSTTIKYSIPQQSKVIIKVFDVLGNEIETLVNNEKPAGNYEVEFSGIDSPSGVYFYQLKTQNFVETKKMLLIK